MRDLRRTRGLAVALSTLLITSVVDGCGDGDATDTIALEGDPLQGTVATVDGGQLDLGEFADADLVVWFWAPW